MGVAPIHRFINTYPRVEINPLTVPSAYRDTMSPICKKEAGESFISLCGSITKTAT